MKLFPYYTYSTYFAGGFQTNLGQAWCTKRDEIKADHLKERAPADLREGWKAWIVEHLAGKEGGAAVAVPSSGVLSVERD